MTQARAEALLVEIGKPATMTRDGLLDLLTVALEAAEAEGRASVVAPSNGNAGHLEALVDNWAARGWLAGGVIGFVGNSNTASARDGHRVRMVEEILGALGRASRCGG